MNVSRQLKHLNLQGLAVLEVRIQRVGEPLLRVSWEEALAIVLPVDRIMGEQPFHVRHRTADVIFLTEVWASTRVYVLIRPLTPTELLTIE